MHYKTHLLSDEVNIKKYFYALRPLLAAKWILDKKTTPPMLFEKLMEEELETELVPEVSRLWIGRILFRRWERHQGYR